MRMLYIILTIFCLSSALYCKDYEYLRDITYNDYLDIECPELKLRAYLMHFEPVKEFTGGSTDDLEGWDQEIFKEGRNIIPALMTLVDENEIIPNEYIDIIGFELDYLIDVIQYLLDKESLTTTEREWLYNKYRSKISTYLIEYRDINPSLIRFYRITRKLFDPEFEYDNSFYQLTLKERLRFIFIVYSEEGYKNLYIDDNFYKFDDYDEIVKKYNP